MHPSYLRTHHASSLSLVSRREFLRRAAILGLAGSAGVRFLAACAPTEEADVAAEPPPEEPDAPSRPLTVAFHEAHLTRYPFLDAFAEDIGERFPFVLQQAPVEGFGAGAFIAEAAREESTWDAYTSMTPFIEMDQLVRAGAIVPWDDFLPEGVLDDILPQVREEGSVDGQLYNFPWVVDVVVASANASVLERADIDPEVFPQTWDEWIENARRVEESGAADFGNTFDGGGWRSIAPIAHSISTDIYREDGLIDWTHDAVVEALEILRRLFELSAPYNLDPGVEHGGFGGTPDRGIWAAEDAGYYLQFTNAPITLAANWTDPGALRLGRPPTVPGGEGSTVFWTTGAALFTYGENKEDAGRLMDEMTTDEQMWRAAAGQEDPIGQLPGRSSVWQSWEEERPDWLADWALELRETIDVARPVQGHPLGFGFQQFLIARPFWEEYLTGDETDARAALQRAMGEVESELEAAEG